jgi:hypothetical protein
MRHDTGRRTPSLNSIYIEQNEGLLCHGTWRRNVNRVNVLIMQSCTGVSAKEMQMCACDEHGHLPEAQVFACAAMNMLRTRIAYF